MPLMLVVNLFEFNAFQVVSEQFLSISRVENHTITGIVVVVVWNYVHR